MTFKYLLKGFTHPDAISFEVAEQEGHYGRFTIFPFERGYGVTMGNSLRRILLTSIQGYAISAVRIVTYDENGQEHLASSEYAPIPGLIEDTAEFLAKLKGVRLSLPGDEFSRMIRVEKKGPGTLLGSDFALHGIQVSNPDAVIAHLNEKAHVALEVQIDLGRGYIPSEVQVNYVDVVGTIPLDSIYSPITKVKYTIENTRVGQRSDYDKLVIEVWTDGTVSPSHALVQAARLAKEQYNAMLGLLNDSCIDDGSYDESYSSYRLLLDESVDVLGLSVRSANCLKSGKINTLSDLVAQKEVNLADLRNFGKKSLEEIKQRLEEYCGLSLGMTYEEALKKLKETKSALKG